jgi:hypothetical protein
MKVFGLFVATVTDEGDLRREAKGKSSIGNRHAFRYLILAVPCENRSGQQNQSTASGHHLLALEWQENPSAKRAQHRYAVFRARGSGARLTLSRGEEIPLAQKCSPCGTFGAHRAHGEPRSGSLSALDGNFFARVRYSPRPSPAFTRVHSRYSVHRIDASDHHWTDLSAEPLGHFASSPSPVGNSSTSLAAH